MSNHYTKLLYEISRPGRPGFSVAGLPKNDKHLSKLPKKFLRADTAPLPSVTQVDVVRHYTNLSTKNVGIDTCFYPLGSCTMKHNPRVNEWAASQPGHARVHPMTPPDCVQGLLRMYHELENDLCELSGMDAVSLQPAAGAQGELAALLIMKAYFQDIGQAHRDEILVPDSAHGTNPASCTFAGFKAVPVKSGKDGLVSLSDLKAHIGPNTAGMMITNPNTLGMFEVNIREIADALHEDGALLYMDGANFNAVMGYTRPGDFGADVQHFNLHKTFSTPHGGGGPGLGAIGLKKHLEPYMMIPRVEKRGDEFTLNYDLPKTIGRVRSFLGNSMTVVRAYTYIRSYGAEGLKKVTENAVLNANYLFSRLKKHFVAPHDRLCMHEFVLEATKQEKLGVTATDIAKSLLDYGVHPMTIYFPLIVHECMMIEPTETESKATLDAFADIMEDIARRAESDPAGFKNAPLTKPVTRMDEVRAAKQPILRWTPNSNPGA